MNHVRARSVFFGAAALCLAGGSAAADPVTFAQVNEGSAGNGISWTNSGAGSATMNTTTPGGDLVSFTFENLAGLAPGLSGPLAAKETINGGAGVTTTAVAQSAGEYDVQAINAAVTISYRLVSPIDGLSNLLTITIRPTGPGASGLEFTGQTGGSGAASSTSEPGGASYTMTFSSDFADFVLADPISADFSYSSLAPGMQIGADGILSSFSAEDTATFSATASPAQVREPASLGVLMAGLIGLGALRRGRVFVA